MAITIGGTPDEQLFTPLIDKEVHIHSLTYIQDHNDDEDKVSLSAHAF